MHETPEDLRALQDVIDRTHRLGGPQLNRIVTPERRLSAEELAARLQGMCLLTVATVTADGRPLAGPVDGVFYRGAFHFSSSPDSVRLAHLRARPQVSATHLPGEEFAVTVHGRARFIDISPGSADGLRRTLLDVYVPRYGPQWESFLDEIGAYVRIEAERLYSFRWA